MDFQYAKIDILLKYPKPQAFIGSMLRGALGYSLKKVVCINPSFKCRECFAKENCFYYDFFEKRNSYHKYRFDFLLEDDIFRFGFYLFEDDAKKLPYILSAFHKLFKETGLTKDRIKYNEFYIYIDNSMIYNSKEFHIPKNYKKLFHIDSFCPNILVKFVTPLRLKKRNIFLRSEEIELFDIVNSIYQRGLKLQGKEFAKLPFTPKGKIVKKELSFKDMARYSNRQKTKMKLGGLTGKIEIRELDKESYKLLKMGEIIAVGKQTVFGLGKIKVEDIR